MSTQTAIVKKGETTRLLGQVFENDMPMDLTGLTLTVKLATPDKATFLTATSGTGPALNDYYFDVTAANLATLGNPSQVYFDVTLKNASNVIFASGANMLNVVL